jgi:soluble lytic murein transglycosylase-like protein
MVKGAALIGAAGLLAYAAWITWRQATTHPVELETETDSIEGEIVNKTVSIFRLWRAPAQYAYLIDQAEREHGIPTAMLERLLWQESRYRQDIITGRVRSPAGALGIAQFMPATAAEFGIDPLKPEQAIPAAARYLRRLFNRFGNWTEALAAYNWGQGNVARRGLGAAPKETRNYYTQILADVNDISAPATYA